MRKTLLLGCAAAALAAPAAADTVVVHVFNFDFSINPEGGAIVDAVINAGDTVRWQFDAFGHSTTAVAGIAENWDSMMMNQGEHFDHTFSNLGVFAYYCDRHGFDLGNGAAGGMSGTVTVVPEPATWVVLLGVPSLLFARKRWVSGNPANKR